MNGKKLTALLGTAVLTMGILAGCGSTAIEIAAVGTAVPATTVEMTVKTSAMAGGTEDQATAEAENAPSAGLSGAISMVGSTSMEKFANTLSESFMEKYPNVMVTAEFVGSDARIETTSSGTAGVGNSSRSLKGEEKAGGVAESIIAIDGIAVMVGEANTVEDLAEQQPSNIYEGKVTNWRDAGGDDAPIVVIGRESRSGTRGTFKELLKLEDMCRYSSKLGNTGAVMTKVTSTPDAAGYVSLDVLDDTVKAVKLEGAEPTEKNVEADPYFLNCPFVMATKGDISEQNELVKALFSYIYSDEGAEIVKSVGLIAIDK